MFLRLNQYFFGIVIFSLQVACIATFAYALMLTASLMMGQIEQRDPWSLLIGTAAMVFGASCLSSIIAFTLSIFLKRKFRKLSIKNESFVILILAAIPAIICSIILVHSAFSLLNLAIYLAAGMTIYLGSYIHRSTWQTLSKIDSCRSLK